MTTRMPYRAQLPSPRTARGLDSVAAVTGAPGSTMEHARVVEAADAERKRLARNLHDGAQQRLASLALLLRLARANAGVDPERTEQLLEDADAELAAALRELRDLASGLDPTALCEHGLGRAIELLVERTPFPVRVDAPSLRLPGQVERAAYYIVSEALANASKHAEPTQAMVFVAREGKSLSLEIRDDGTGGADLAGTGIAGMRDRAEALGGVLAVESPPGAGTTVRAVLPIAGGLERSSRRRGEGAVHARGRRLRNG